MGYPQVGSNARIGTVDSIIQQPSRVSFDRKRGLVLVQTFKGPKDLIEAKADEVRNTCISYNIKEGLVSTIIIEYDNSIDGGIGFLNEEEYVDWEVQPVTLTKDIRYSPYFDPESSDNSGLSESQKDDLLNQYKKIESDITNASKSDLTGTDYGATNGVQEITSNYVKLRLKGVTDYYEFSYVFRQTLTLWKSAVISIAYSGVGEVVSSITIPGWADFVNDLYEEIDGTGEFLKMAPYVRRASKSKVQVVLEWHWAREWSGTLYSGGSATP